jgi:hypothetical protein
MGQPLFFQIMNHTGRPKLAIQVRVFAPETPFAHVYLMLFAFIADLFLAVIRAAAHLPTPSYCFSLTDPDPGKRLQTVAANPPQIIIWGAKKIIPQTDGQFFWPKSDHPLSPADSPASLIPRLILIGWGCAQGQHEHRRSPHCRPAIKPSPALTLRPDSSPARTTAPMPLASGADAARAGPRRPPDHQKRDGHGSDGDDVVSQYLGASDRSLSKRPPRI